MQFAALSSTARSRAKPALAIAAAVTAHGLRMGANLVILKMIAVVLGPTGLGSIGNLLSVISFMMVFAGGGIANGITKYVAQHQGRPRTTLRIYETAFALGFAVSGLVFVLCVIGAQPIAVALFGNSDLWWLSVVLGIAHLACFVGSATIAVINGQHRADLFAAVVIAAYLGSIPVAFLLIKSFALPGAALALMLMAGCTALPSLWLLLRAPALRLVRLRLHRPETRLLLRFSAMTFVSAISFPVAETVVRSTVIDTLGLAQAGIWQASIRLSGAILGFYTVYLATQYMPRLSASKSRDAIKIVVRTLAGVGTAFVIVGIAIYMLRAQIVPLLFSSAFAPLENLLAWQLLGDLFRVCAYVIGFCVVAKARLNLHVAAEFVQYLIYVAVTVAVVLAGGDLLDVVRAYTLSYAIYFTLALIGLAIYERSSR